MARFCGSPGDQHVDRDVLRNSVSPRGSEFRLRHSLGSGIRLGLLVSGATDVAACAPWWPCELDHEGSTSFLAVPCRPPVLRCGNSRRFSAPGTLPREVAPAGSTAVLARTEPPKAVWDCGACPLAFRVGGWCAVAHPTRIKTIWAHQRRSSTVAHDRPGRDRPLEILKNVSSADAHPP